jgi:amidase
MSQLPPVVRPPSREQVRALADHYHFDLSEEELDDYHELIQAKIGFCERLDELHEPPVDRPRFERDPGYRPGTDEDPYNAVVTRCRVAGADSGPLDGYDVGVKDNVAVAGVEMTCASKVLEGFVPLEDAFVVERLLDAGATITAKTNMDEMAVSGSGEMSAFGPIFNPWDDDHLAGGSSGGSAVAVATGDVDVAIGTDQAGSLRTPASWSGCVGLKPTHGLVSFRGAAPLGHSFDHVGPMARSVDDVALALDVITGPDPHDPRQREPPEIDGSYCDALADRVDGLTIGVLTEGFEFAGGEEAVNEGVRAAVDRLDDLGAEVEELSIPWHVDGFFVWLAVENEDAAMVWDAECTGYFVGGRYDTHFAKHFAKARRARGDDFAPTVKLKCMLGRYLKEAFHGHYHGLGQNLRTELTAAYDDALEAVDLLAMPTTPMTAFEHKADVDRVELVNRAQGKKGRTRNTMPFDMSGHPAISVPCGMADGLPIGLMLVGRQFEEATVLRAASAFERDADWQSLAF